MKKVLLALVVLSLIAGAGFAQEAGTISAGAKLGGVIGFHSFEKQEMEGAATITPDSKFNFTFGAFGAYTIIDNLSVQAELNFMISQGGEGSASGIDFETTYNSLDIPVLIKYSFLNDPVIFGAQAGPQLSIPLGKLEGKVSYPGGSKTYKSDSDGITFGAVAGVYVGYPLGPGSIIGDLRFLFDFNALKRKENGKSEDLLTRRGLIFTLGYGFSF
jgi:hypothetical protein